GNGGLSARHTTRNFPNREGSKPAAGQTAAVMLMDARSIAATARNHGVLTAATEIDYAPPAPARRFFDRGVYEKRVYFGFGKADGAQELRFGPNITEWPKIPALGKHLLLRLDAVLRDEVTTTDELIPSGDASSYRSNPQKLATFTLSRREPAYVGRTAETRALTTEDAEVQGVLKALGASAEGVQIGSCIFANKPGDGSAREQAATCQRILGGCANVCYEYATKRYRSNCINWGMLPFTLERGTEFSAQAGDYVFVPDVRKLLASGAETLPAALVSDGRVQALTLRLGILTAEERQILLDGCLMNYYAAHGGEE
ncbi:MAG: hydratase, partial [Oscillibacter sp.]|nr:hydratase [Oscillibacter sp.]